MTNAHQEGDHRELQSFGRLVDCSETAAESDTLLKHQPHVRIPGTSNIDPGMATGVRQNLPASASIVWSVSIAVSQLRSHVSVPDGDRFPCASTVAFRQCSVLPSEAIVGGRNGTTTCDGAIRGDVRPAVTGRQAAGRRTGLGPMASPSSAQDLSTTNIRSGRSSD